VKVTVNLPRELANELRQLAEREHKTFTQVLKEAISLKLFVDDEVVAQKRKLLIENADKSIERIVFR
jgi:predicted transcriptional regulator